MANNFLFNSKKKFNKNSVKSQRQLKVGEELRHLISNALLRENFYDEHIKNNNITITEVNMSPDLKNAKIYIMPLGGKNKNDVLNSLNKVSGRIKKIISTVTVSKISLKYALAKFYLIDLALKGCKDPINEFMRIFKKNLYFKSVVEDIKKVKRLKSKPHPLVVKKLGMACSYPGTFNSSIHSIINSTNYKGAILKTIKAGGCNCSRVNFIGAYFAALKGLGTIPKSWIKKTDLAKKIFEQK